MRAYVHAWETLFEKPQRDTLIGALIDTHGFLSQPGSRCIHTLTQAFTQTHTLWSVFVTGYYLRECFADKLEIRTSKYDIYEQRQLTNMALSL